MKYLLSLMSSGETIQMVVRQHWIVIARSVVLNGLAIAALALVAGIGFGTSSTGGRIVAWAAAAAAVVPAAACLRDMSRWSSRQFVITTRRVMEVSGVFNKQVSDSNLDKVNDCVLRQSVFGRALGYGDLQIITGSDLGVDSLPRIRQPLQFQRALLDNKEDFDTLVRTGDGAAVPPTDIPGAIERLAEMHRSGLVTDEEFERKKADLLARM